MYNDSDKIKAYDDSSRVCHTIRASIDRVIKLAPEDSIFVESGCYRGDTTKHFVQRLVDSGKKFQYFCIDNWLLENVTERNEDNLAFFKQNVGEVLLSNINIISCDALEAISKFEDDSVFYCLLDDLHVYDHVFKQIALWLPKMKDFSILSGDDYYCDGVFNAVSKYFKKEDIISLHGNAGFLVENPKDKSLIR